MNDDKDIGMVVHEAEVETLASCSPLTVGDLYEAERTITQSMGVPAKYLGIEVVEVEDPKLVERNRQIFNTAEICWNMARVKYPEMEPWGQRPECLETATLVATYAFTRQWSPLPVGTPAANDRTLQTLMNETVSTLLAHMGGSQFGSMQVVRPPQGWASGRMQPRCTPAEVEAAWQMGYGAQYYQGKVREEQPEAGVNPFIHPFDLSIRQKDELRVAAEHVLRLAKIHQMDAVRVAWLEHKIEPVFSGPIVADVCFGGMGRVV